VSGVEPGALVGEGTTATPAPETPPPTVPEATWEFAHTSVGNAYIRVYVDGVQVSQHTQQHKAVEEAQRQKRRNPGARVTYRPEFEIEVTLI
jgi:hypothetical protein